MSEEHQGAGPVVEVAARQDARRLRDELAELRKEQFNLRMAVGLGPAGAPDQHRKGHGQDRAREDDAERELDRAQAGSKKRDERETAEESCRQGRKTLTGTRRQQPRWTRRSPSRSSG